MIGSEVKILDKNLANMIAAGEVVERPASVVKELVENAFDAHATSISVEIKNGGKTYIRVSDDGCGMTAVNAKKAFLRHATSKISSLDDLFNISTMGFRGEALAAISSVSKVEVFTSIYGDSYGTHLVLEGGDEVLCEEMALASGTTIVVKDLFYNTPARYNFLKKDSTETANIVSLMHKLALSRPGLSMKLIVDGKNTLSIDAGSSQIDAIYTVLGKEISDNLLQIDKGNTRVVVNGYISRPRCSRSNRNYQFLFVNGRYVKSKTVTAAIDRAYHNSLMNGKHPVTLIYIDIEPRKIDVNVHPTKMEIKFSDESLVFDMVYRAVKEGLEKEVQFNQEVSRYGKSSYSGAPQVVADFLRNLSNAERQALEITEEPRHLLTLEELSTSGKPITSEQFTISEEEKKVTSVLPDNSGYVSASAQFSPSGHARIKDLGYYKRKPKLDMSELSEKFCEEKFDDSYIITDEIPYRYVGELFKTYIIIESGFCYYLVDKHAAHERILFNKIYEKFKTDERFSQTLIDVIPVSLSPEEADVARRYKEEIIKYGFEFVEFGDNDFLIRSLPYVISPGDSVAAFVELVQIFDETGEAGITEYENKAIKMLACKAAIKAGFDSSDEELEHFIRDLIQQGNINYCPHGRPIICEYFKKDIEKDFKRKL